MNADRVIKPESLRVQRSDLVPVPLSPSRLLRRSAPRNDDQNLRMAENMYVILKRFEQPDEVRTFEKGKHLHYHAGKAALREDRGALHEQYDIMLADLALDALVYWSLHCFDLLLG